ncbi:MAG TPA: hypothetical protein VFU73_02920 [Actinocrinis sp.]|nr:hypothetical protein [Actinocrinis sp.]
MPEFPDFTRLVEEFPGPVAIAVVPPAGTMALCGWEDSDNHPWALHVTYATTGYNALRVRTVRGSVDWEPVIRTVESLGTAMGAEGRTAPKLATTVKVDGVPIPGTRIDLPRRSGVQLDWQGQRVFSIGDRDLIDDLELRTGTSADFAGFVAEFAEFVARRRAEHQGD